MQKRNGCRVIAHICRFAWFHIENETGRLMITLQGDLANSNQPIFDRVGNLPEDVRAAFLEKIEGEFKIEHGEDFDKIVRLVEKPGGNATDAAEFCRLYGCD